MQMLLVLCACVAAASAQYVVLAPLSVGWPMAMPLVASAKAADKAEAEVKVEAERRKRSLLISGVDKAKVRVATLDAVEADTPADTKLLKFNEKEVEVPAVRYVTYAAHFNPIITMLRKKRDLVAKVKTAALKAVEAKTPADTTLLKMIEQEHSIVMPMQRVVYLI